jgi:hypothetical protein
MWSKVTGASIFTGRFSNRWRSGSERLPDGQIMMFYCAVCRFTFPFPSFEIIWDFKIFYLLSFFFWSSRFFLKFLDLIGMSLVNYRGIKIIAMIMLVLTCAF